MSCRIHRSRSAIFRFALFTCFSGLLAACSSGGSDSPAARESATATAASPTPDPAPGPTPDPVPGPTPVPVPDPVAPPANAAPSIAGTAISSVEAGSFYSFRPTASDANGDELTFQIQTKPSWATFSTVTGELSGTPAQSHAGTYANIVVSASDGAASVALPSFSITVTQSTPHAVTLSWTAPTENTDGSALLDLAGFTIVYGPSTSMLHQSVRISNPSVSHYLLENLPSGAYYFGVSAYTTSGAESELSSLVSKVIG